MKEVLDPVLKRVGGALAFLVGYALVYGENAYENVPREKYGAALAATGFKRRTLWQCAHVSRKVESSIRIEELSWNHHLVVAKLPPDRQREDPRAGLKLLADVTHMLRQAQTHERHT